MTAIAIHRIADAPMPRRGINRNEQETGVVSCFASMYLCGYGGYILNCLNMTDCGTAFPVISHASYGCHLLDHLAADRAGFPGGQVTVVAALQVDADLRG